MPVTPNPPRDGIAPGRPVHPTNGLERARVTEIQRARMLAAMAEVCAEHGAANVTVAHVVARSGVSRRTFYEQFADREECFLAAFDEALTRTCERMLPAYESEGRWRERIRNALVAFLAFLDEEPFLGRLMVVETLGAGAGALRRRQQALVGVIAAIDEGRREARPGKGPPPLIAEGLVGGVLAVLHARLVEPRRGSLVGLAGPLMSMIVLPYLGVAAARRELERPVSIRRNGSAPAPANPLRDLGMRLTYRTVRVLMSVAAHPGSSNREIGLASDIYDQGQISKLLTRLHRLGLIENTGAGQARGAPNAWMLTGKGTRVEQAIAHQAIAPGIH